MANRWWVGGTGTWDASTTTHWSSVGSGGAGGASVPGSSDTAIFDGLSGGGTVTVNTTVNITSITSGAFTGTLDFSTNNNDVTIQTFSGSGTGIRTINMGNGTWTVTGTSGTIWNTLSSTNLTWNSNSSTLLLSATTASPRVFASNNGITYNILSIAANTGGGSLFLQVGATTTVTTFLVAAPNYIMFYTITGIVFTNPLAIAGSPSAQILFTSSGAGTGANIGTTIGNSNRFKWVGFRDIIFNNGTFLATNSFDLGHNSAGVGASISILPGSVDPTFSAGFFG